MYGLNRRDPVLKLPCDSSCGGFGWRQRRFASAEELPTICSPSLAAVFERRSIIRHHGTAAQEFSSKRVHLPALQWDDDACVFVPPAKADGERDNQDDKTDCGDPGVLARCEVRRHQWNI